MSDWIGPNVYRIESYTGRKSAVSFAGGSKADGTAVVIWNSDPNKNDRFMFVHLGTGSSGKEEYHIINRKSGTYLTCNANATQGHLQGNTLSPWLNRTRWCIIPTRNGTGAYWIVPAANPKMMLVPDYGKMHDGSPLTVWAGPLDSESCWWYLRLDDDAILQCPNMGRAPAPKAKM